MRYDEAGLAFIGLGAIQDHDGDGVGDFYTYTTATIGVFPRGHLILSGRTGDLIRHLPAPLGVSPSVIGEVSDHDGDGFDDFVTGLHGGNFGFFGVRLIIWSSVDAAHTVSFDVVNGDVGWVAGGADYDGDGSPEVVLSPAPGRAWIVSVDPTPTILYEFTRSTPFRPSYLALQDVDGDGTDDFALGWHVLRQVELYSGATGSLLHSVDGPFTPGESWGLGYPLCRISDIDGDGLDDLVARDVGRRRLVAFSSADLTELWSRRFVAEPVEESVLSAFPGAIAPHEELTSGGDVNGDGYDDLVSHSILFTSPSNESYFGWFDVYSGKDGTCIYRLEREQTGLPGFPGGGTDLLEIGDDYDGDGRAEILWYDRDYKMGQQWPSAERGLLQIFRGMSGGFGDISCVPAPNSTGESAELIPYGPATEGTTHLHVEIAGAPPERFAQLAWGPKLAAGASGVLGPWGELCFEPSGAQRYGAPIRTELDGTAVVEIDWSQPGIQASWQVGTTWVTQALYRDDPAFGGANTTNAVEFVVNGH